MLCFNDVTYCSSKDCQANCPAKVTKELKKKAKEAGLPICYADLQDTCFNYKSPLKKSKGEQK